MNKKPKDLDSCMLEAEKLLRRRIEIAKARFGRRMKSPKRVTESIEGRGLGDLPYAPWEKTKP